MSDMTTVTTCGKCGLSYRESLAFPHECADWTKGNSERQSKVERKERFGYAVLTGRHKILDYDKSDGQQIATADNEDAAKLIRRALNNYDALTTAVRQMRQRHKHKAELANFDDCGCEDCSSLEAALNR